MIARTDRSTDAHPNPEVPIRHMDFSGDRGNLPRYFYDNDPFASAFFMAFSAVIPHGERFFIDSVRNYRDRVRDPELQQRVAGFIGQEAMHGQEHDISNAIYEAMGFPMKRLDRLSRRGLKLARRWLPLRIQLAMTVALEHHTAIVSEYTFRHPEMQARFAPEALRFTLWHMMEETEHKAVAFDVFRSTGGSYLVRAGTMIPMTAILLGTLLAFQLRILAADGTLWQLRRHLRGVGHIYGPRGLWAGLIPAFLDYFKPGFHPSQHDTDTLLRDMQARLFGEHGELRTQLKKTILPRARLAAAA
ncbi:MAG: metal-dependent hydrolase [Nevskia sp.]|nr:metal-dependent hydrolase [Nevskia sp.]